MALQPDEILARLEAWMQPFAKEHGGQVSVATDPWHFIELLAESPNGWRCVLNWAGESNLVEHGADAGTIVEHEIELGVSANPGLTVNPGEALLRPRPGQRAPLLRIVGQVRDRARALLYPDVATGRFLTLKRTEPVTVPGALPIAAWKITLALTAAAPEVQFVEPPFAR